MAMATAASILLAVQYALDHRFGYVWGGDGEHYTQQLAEKWKNDKGRSVPQWRSKSTYYTKDCAKWFGRQVVDCSGLIVWAIRQSSPKYGDRNAQAFKEQFAKSGAISSIPEIPGLAVWRSGHIGIYIGNGDVIEARGTDFGVVKTKLKERNFTHWGYIRDVDYAAPAITPPIQEDVPHNAICKGGSVHIRQKQTKNSPSLGIVNKGHPLVVQAAGAAWPQVSTFIGGKAVTGYMSGAYIETLALG